MKIIITALVYIFSFQAIGACPSSEPRETLNCYFTAVDKNDVKSINEVYLGLTEYHFNNATPPHRELHKIVTLKDNIVNSIPNGTVPLWARKGNKEIMVKEKYTNYEHMVSFYLTQKNGIWFLAGHTAQNQPE